MAPQTSSTWSPAALANLAKGNALIGWGGPHDEPTEADVAWGDLVWLVVYAMGLMNMMSSPEGVEELAKEALHAVLVNPGADGNTDVDGGSVRRMMTSRETQSYINHGNGSCKLQCCGSVYDAVELRR